MTLYSDPADARLLGQPFDAEGLPVRRMVWIEKGILKNLAYSRFWAQKQGKEPTGFPLTGGLALAGGTKSTEELIAGCSRGVLVTHFFYIRALDPRTVLQTGLTRWCGLPGLTGAHLLRADTMASQTRTREKQLRSQPDAVADWVLLVEGYDQAAVHELHGRALAPRTLEEHGARADAVGNLYDLVYLVTCEDVLSLAASAAMRAPSAQA